MTVKGTKHLVPISVVNEDWESRLGDKPGEELGLVKRVYHLNTVMPVKSSCELFVP